MAVQTPQVEIDPYKTNIPMVQVPQDQQQSSLGITPADPLGHQPGRYLPGRGTGGLAIGDAIMKGILQGHAEKARRKTAEAQATFDALKRNEEITYGSYQDARDQAARALGTNPDGTQKGDPDANETVKARWDAYGKAFDATTQAMTQYAIPDKKKGSQGGKPDKKKPAGAAGQAKSPDVGEGQAPPPEATPAQKMWHGMQNYFAANPHLVPQLAISTRELSKLPKGENRDYRMQEADLRAKEAQTREANAAAGRTEQETATAEYNQKRDVLASRVMSIGTPEDVQKMKPEDLVANHQAKDLDDAKALIGMANEIPNQRLAKEPAQQQIIDKLMTAIATIDPKTHRSAATSEQLMLARMFNLLGAPKDVIKRLDDGTEILTFIDMATGQDILGADGKPISRNLGKWPEHSAGAGGGLTERINAVKDMYRQDITAHPEAYGIPTDPKTGKPDTAKVDEAALNMATHNPMLGGDGNYAGIGPSRDPFQQREMGEVLAGLSKFETTIPSGQTPNESEIGQHPWTVVYPRNPNDLSDTRPTSQQVGYDYLHAFSIPWTVTTDEGGGYQWFRAYEDGPVGGQKTIPNPYGFPADILEAQRRVYKQKVIDFMLNRLKVTGGNYTRQDIDKLMGGTALWRPVIGYKGPAEQPVVPEGQATGGGRSSGGGQSGMGSSSSSGTAPSGKRIDPGSGLGGAYGAGGLLKPVSPGNQPPTNPQPVPSFRDWWFEGEKAGPEDDGTVAHSPAPPTPPSAAQPRLANSLETMPPKGQYGQSIPGHWHIPKGKWYWKIIADPNGNPPPADPPGQQITALTWEEAQSAFQQKYKMEMMPTSFQP